MPHTFVYGLVEGGGGTAVVALPRERLVALTQARYVVATCDTWAQVQQLASPELYRELIEQSEYGEYDEEPDADDAFETPYGFDDGDWPAWPQQEMLTVIPASIRQAFGTRGDSTLNGWFYHVPPEAMADFVRALEQAGFSCQRDDALVQAASGYADEDELRAVLQREGQTV
ncbi:hypothetical protein [Deinococcus yavapaiensis]|uniref:Uncharacterized protein n=1 Tax=Deinococcus yavapaiensis KR-236 TaxID=694435 RepID=A0A318S899_9DEIO|nr:hypothetical protein [Deinococcus yavapaiensis]PYE52011.1 hypothetical protein DES52_11357 [Deinococcus yavapaiensis KR-236]